MNSWNDYEAATKIEAINYVSRVLYYQLQLKGKVPVSARLLEAWSLLAALAGDAVGLHDRRLAISLLLEFHCMLRTGNLLKIRKMDFSLIKQSHCQCVCSWNLYPSSTVELPHISFGSTVSWIAPWSEEGGYPPRQHSSTSARRSKKTLLQVSKIASWRLSSMATLHLGRLRRPSSGREARSRGHSPRASGAGGEACVHRDCNPQVWTTEGTKASFANVGFTTTSERWMK